MKIPQINLNNLTQRPPVKTVWRQLGHNDEPKLFEPFIVNRPYIGELLVTISKYKQGYQNYKINIENKIGKSLGSEIICIENDRCKKITGFDIKVEDEYRRKTSFRLGELLRMASIMEMLENKSSHIKICSKNTAVYFHGRYKFEPCITAFAERDDALKSVISDNSPNFSDLCNKAKKLLEEVEKTKDDAANQRDLCVRTNALVKEYIERALLEKQPEKNHPFKNAMYMILKKETVVKYKDFFNKIFEQQGIDYKI